MATKKKKVLKKSISKSERTRSKTKPKRNISYKDNKKNSTIKNNNKPKKKTSSSTTDVLKHLQTNKTITARQANMLYDIGKLAPIINVLKKKGYNITPVTVIEKNRYGNTQQTSKYVLI